MTFLAVVVVLIFSFAFVVEGARPPAPVVAGILWVALVVSGTVALSRAFDREREGEAIRSLLLSPAPRGAIYLGKLAATVALMLVTETVLTALCARALLGRDATRCSAASRCCSRSAPSASPPRAASSRRRCCARAAATRCCHAALPDHRADRDRRRARHRPAAGPDAARLRRRAVLDAVPVRPRHPVRHRRPVGV